MRRPVSPSPRRSQDSRSHTPPPPVTQLRRSSSDVSSRPNRFLAKLKQAGASTTSSSAASHSRTGSNPALIPPSSPTTAIASKSASSPNAKSTRDMHRLGTLPAQATLAPAMSNPASASSLSLASTLSNNTITTVVPSTTDPWHKLHVHVLQLFNGEPLRMPIEELNRLVKRHISTVVSRSVSRAISSLEQDITGLLARGMLTLNVKVSELDDKKLLPRLAEVWEFFWHNILPYVEGVFHPLKTDKLIHSLSRTPKSADEACTSIQSIDVRVLALRSFRDSIILPLFSRLHVLLSSATKERDIPVGNNRSPYLRKLQQMLLVLVSSAQHCHCRTTPVAAPSQGESAVVHLLRAIRSPHSAVSGRPFSLARHPSFFTGATPRDRRGRIARKSALYASSAKTRLGTWDREESDENDDETPRNDRFGVERDREKEFLESLRSPEVDGEEDSGVGGPAGGWGLGRGQEHQGGEDDDEEETLEWDQAQDVVERMVGLRG